MDILPSTGRLKDIDEAICNRDLYSTGSLASRGLKPSYFPQDHWYLYVRDQFLQGFQKFLALREALPLPEIQSHIFQFFLADWENHPTIKFLAGSQADFSVDKVPTRITKFEEMGLCEELLKGIREYGFEKPPVVMQIAAWPPLSGQDVLLRADQGTSKEACTAISLLQQLDFTKQGGPQCLWVTPTRELAQGVAHLVKTIGHHTPLKVYTPLGPGTQPVPECHILFGTVGRLHDLRRHGFWTLENFRYIVYDEVRVPTLLHGEKFDEILARGSELMRDFHVDLLGPLDLTPDLQHFFSGKNFDYPTLSLIKQMVSATKDPPPLRFAINAVRGKQHQYYIDCQTEEEKLELLQQLIGPLHTVVFSRTAEESQALCQEFAQLAGEDFCQYVHSVVLGRGPNLLFSESKKSFGWAYCGSAMGSSRIRKGLTINYDFPDSLDKYCSVLHEDRLVISFVLPFQKESLQQLESRLDLPINPFLLETLQSFIKP